MLELLMRSKSFSCFFLLDCNNVNDDFSSKEQYVCT